MRVLRVAELVALRLSLPARLSRQPLDALLDNLAPGRRSRPSAPHSLAVITRDLLRAEWGLARLPWVPNTCLYRAMARYGVLRRSGIRAEFVMGLAAGGVQENGHAWVELEGRPFEEKDEVTRYAVTFRYPPASNNDNTEML